jgi:hypothetical protein
MYARDKRLESLANNTFSFGAHYADPAMSQFETGEGENNWVVEASINKRRRPSLTQKRYAFKGGADASNNLSVTATVATKR